MSMRVDKTVSASLLPEEWDGIAESYFQRREFLRHCETYNACGQRYYLLRENEVVRAGEIGRAHV
jgi:hypothetical protein